MSDNETAGLALHAEAELAAPNPGALINSLRAFGYELDTAVADLIDNSITAEANRVDIRFDWNNGHPRLSLTDNGVGMTEAELVAALRLGSSSPVDSRAKEDLGRFGLGLKTASFSQARRLVVASKTQNSEIVSRCWDLDHVEDTNQWRLLYGDAYLSESDYKRLKAMRQGTIVILENLDRLFADSSSDAKRRSEFFARAKKLSAHLGAVFHRFFAGHRQLEIWINPEVSGAKPVEHWDPFLSRHEKTQILPHETLRVGNETVEIQPYVLPHQSAFQSPEAHKLASGIKGWNAQQGYYVYRNNRLLVSGSWLNLGIRQEEHYKLARLALDISNTLDDIWSIDVRKSQAIPPVSLKADLIRIARRVRKQAKEVYGHRGRIINAPVGREVVQLWHARMKNDKVSYRINRKYPLLEQLKTQLDTSGKQILTNFLTLVEETIPVNKIYFNAVETPECHMEAFEGERDAELIEIAETLVRHYRAGLGYSYCDALDVLMSLEPFDQHTYLRETLQARSCNEH